jgi:hypothetical protein
MINPRNATWSGVVMMVVIAGSVFASTALSAADQVDLGWWVGPSHPVPAAACHPHCDPNGGDDFDFTDPIPPNVVLDNSTARVNCSGQNGCVFDPSHATVDNATHNFHGHIRSRSEAVTVTGTAHIVAIH